MFFIIGLQQIEGLPCAHQQLLLVLSSAWPDFLWFLVLDQLFWHGGQWRIFAVHAATVVDLDSR